MPHDMKPITDPSCTMSSNAKILSHFSDYNASGMLNFSVAAGGGKCYFSHAFPDFYSIISHNMGMNTSGTDTIHGFWESNGGQSPTIL